jgi:small-conductance mechanosensitive channel/CRP-like cAMP-binding protein
LLLLTAAVVPRLVPRPPLWLRVIWRTAVFVLLTLLTQRMLGSPLRPHFQTDHAGEQFWQQLIEAAWWLIAAQVAIAVVRLLVVLEHRPRETQIVSDLLAGVIYVAALLAIVNFAFGVPIRGLLVTSGAIAIVLGLALQSTMSDVFSGIAVGLERPYKAGDLLWVEGGIEGHVIQVNWRSTQIATSDNNTAVVPNSIIAKSRLINRSSPTPIRGETVVIRLDAAAAPEQCIDALTAAIQVCRIMLAAPIPSIACVGLQGDGVAYEIGFSVASTDQLGPARSELYAQVHRHLRHAGIAIAVAGVATLPPVPVPTPVDLLEQSELFGSIPPDQRSLLAEHFIPVWLQSGDVLIREGASPDALFVIASGAVEITTDMGGTHRVVYRMSPGESVGTIGLITGRPYAATATAMTALKAYRLSKEDIDALIKTMPMLAKALDALAQRGQAAIDRSAAADEGADLTHPKLFISRLRNFLHLLGS